MGCRRSGVSRCLRQRPTLGYPETNRNACIVGAGLRPARQSRAGGDHVAVRVRAAQVPPALIPGLLGRRSRPSVAPSARARGESRSGCAHAMARRRPLSWPGEPGGTRSPWIARYDTVRGAPRGRKVDPAHCHTRHVPMNGLSRVSRCGFRHRPGPGRGSFRLGEGGGAQETKGRWGLCVSAPLRLCVERVGGGSSIQDPISGREGDPTSSAQYLGG